MKKVLMFASAAALLLGSCSKDLTTDLTPSVVGDSKIVATYNSGEGTRTHVTNEGGWVYSWDEADAVGVVKATTVQNKTSYSPAPGMFSYNGDAFYGSMALVDGADYYGFYPYSATASDAKTGEVTLTIPSAQLYVGDTFAAGAAPSLGKGTKAEGKDLAMEFKSVASFIRVPVTGQGTVTSVKLEIGDGEEIAGNVVTNYSAFEELTQKGDLPTAELKDGKTDITLYAEEGVELSSEKTYFWFVVSPTTELTSVTLTFNEKVVATRANINADELGANRTLTVGQTSSGAAFNVDLETGDSGVYTISSTLHFLKYVYAATNGVTGADEDLLTADGNLKKAVIINTIDMSKALEDIAAANAGNFEVTPFEYTVYSTYKNAKSIPSIGGGAAYSIEAYDDRPMKDGKPVEGSKVTPAVIKNLTVKGVKGLFTGDKAAANLSFEALTVDASGKPAVYHDLADGESQEAIVYFLTDGTIGDAIENVAFAGDCKLVGPTGGMYERVPVHTALVGVDNVTMGRSVDNKGVVTEDELAFDVYEELPAGVKFWAGDLTIATGQAINIDDKGEAAEAAKKISPADFQKYVHVAFPDKNYFLVYMGAMTNQGEVYLKHINDHATTTDAGWFSFFNSKLNNSYWTGHTATTTQTNLVKQPAFKGKTVAESLLYTVKNGGSLTLLNNIYLSAKHGMVWPVMTESKNVTINGGDFKIWNAVIDGSNIDEYNTSDTYYFTLFGANANVSKLVVDDVTIKVTDKPADPKKAVSATNIVKYNAVVAGLAETYVSATSTTSTAALNNTVTNLTIDTSGYSGDVVIGGIYAKAGEGITNNNFWFKNNSIGVTCNTYTGNQWRATGAAAAKAAQTYGDFVGSAVLTFGNNGETELTGVVATTNQVFANVTVTAASQLDVENAVLKVADTKVVLPTAKEQWTAGTNFIPTDSKAFKMSVQKKTGANGAYVQAFEIYFDAE